MDTQYKEMGASVLKAIKDDPQTGNSMSEYLMSALTLAVTEDLPGGFKNPDDFDEEMESGFDRSDEVEPAIKEYLDERWNDDDQCYTIDDYILLVDYVQRKIWPK
jgi:hypothetical protein